MKLEPVVRNENVHLQKNWVSQDPDEHEQLLLAHLTRNPKAMMDMMYSRKNISSSMRSLFGHTLTNCGKEVSNDVMDSVLG